MPVLNNKKNRTLVWLREDLRLADNPALSDAVKSGDVLVIYIQDENHEYPMGQAQKWWLHESLFELKNRLDLHLHFFKGDPLEIILKLVKKHQLTSVYWNRCYTPYEVTRDAQIKEKLLDMGIMAKSFNGSLLCEPWEIKKDDGTPYKVFTPYYKKMLSVFENRPIIKSPKALSFIKLEVKSLGLNELALIPKIKWYEGFESNWCPGEVNARKRLKFFLKESILTYANDRNRMDKSDGVSRLSSHIHFGEISVNEIWQEVEKLKKLYPKHANNLATYQSELVWREFSYYILFYFNDLPLKNFQKKFDHFPWQKNVKGQKAWQKGETGIPIIDAAMRELWQTGHMHNRARMIVASFLCKNLLQDWRIGASWFWDTLLDADLANNSMGWQWVAGSGVDAAPYFRIFNPVTQSEKFDPSGDYIRKYVPELALLSHKYIHAPWLAPVDVLKKCNITLGRDYPNPIVDLKLSREKALTAFKSIR